MTDKAKEAALPGDHGQFGVDNATEEHKRLKDSPKPTPDPAETDSPAKPQ